TMVAKAKQLTVTNVRDRVEVATALLGSSADLHRLAIENRGKDPHSRRAKKKRTKQIPTPRQPTSLSTKEFYQSWEWKRLRYDYIKDKERGCECCGAAPPRVVINVDHIKPIRRYWHLRLEKANLQLLCEGCNMGKGSHDETDWRDNVVPFPDR